MFDSPRRHRRSAPPPSGLVGDHADKLGRIQPIAPEGAGGAPPFSGLASLACVALFVTRRRSSHQRPRPRDGQAHRLQRHQSEAKARLTRAGRRRPPARSLHRIALLSDRDHADGYLLATRGRPRSGVPAGARLRPRRDRGARGRTCRGSLDERHVTDVVVPGCASRRRQTPSTCSAIAGEHDRVRASVRHEHRHGEAGQDVVGVDFAREQGPSHPGRHDHVPAQGDTPLLCAERLASYRRGGSASSQRCRPADRTRMRPRRSRAVPGRCGRRWGSSSTAPPTRSTAATASSPYARR